MADVGLQASFRVANIRALINFLSIGKAGSKQVRVYREPVLGCDAKWSWSSKIYTVHYPCTYPDFNTIISIIRSLTDSVLDLVRKILWVFTLL